MDETCDPPAGLAIYIYGFVSEEVHSRAGVDVTTLYTTPSSFFEELLLGYSLDRKEKRNIFPIDPRPDRDMLTQLDYT